MTRTPRQTGETGGGIGRRGLLLGGIQLGVVTTLALKLRSMQVEQAEHVTGGAGRRRQGGHPYHLDDAAQRQRVLAFPGAEQDHAGRGVGRVQVGSLRLTTAVPAGIDRTTGPVDARGLHRGADPADSLN